MLELQTLKYKNLRLRQSRYTKLSQTLKGLCLLFFTTITCEIFSELRNQVRKLNIKLYSTVVAESNMSFS